MVPFVMERDQNDKQNRDDRTPDWRRAWVARDTEEEEDAGREAAAEIAELNRLWEISLTPLTDDEIDALMS